MKRFHGIRATRLLVGLLTTGMLCATFIQLSAQSAQTSHADAKLSIGSHEAHEITLNGTIQNITSERVSGSPFGLHLLVASSQGTVDAHLGPYLSKDTKEALHAGVPVQIVGAMETIHGKSFLLARQVIFGGRLVTVRSESGFLIRAHGPRPERSKLVSQTEKTQAELNGGAR